MMKLVQNLGLVALAAVVALAITAVGQGLWGVMTIVNLKSSPAIPWAAMVMAPILAALAAFLSGRGWPRWGAEARRALVPLAPVSAKVWGWALVSGAAGVAALAFLWIVMASLVRVPPNVLPDARGLPPLTIAAILLVSIVAAPLTEEIAFRGYATMLLRRRFGPAAALVIASVMFAAAHLTQGLYAPKLLVYLLVGLMLGVTAMRAGSLLPAMVVHSFGDLVFFTTVWPNDAGRRLISDGGAGPAFYGSLAGLVIFAILWAVTMRQFFRATSPAPAASPPPALGALA